MKLLANVAVGKKGRGKREVPFLGLRRAFPISLTAIFAVVVNLAQAGTYNWNTSSGSWSTSSNWTGVPPAGGPGTAGDIVTISPSGTNTVSLFNTGDGGNATKTIGSLIFNGGTTTIAAGSANGILDFNNNFSLTGVNASIVQTAGSGNISAPVTLTDSLSLTNVNGSGGTNRLFLSGVVSGSGGLVINSGPGTVTISGVANTFGGGVILNTGGTLALGGGTGASSSASAIGTGTLTLNGGTLSAGSSAIGVITTNNAQIWNGDFGFTGAFNLTMGTGAVSLGSSRTVNLNGTAVLSVGGVVSDGGSGYGLTISGVSGGRLSLGGANTYSGGTTLNAGTLSSTLNSGTPFGTGNVLLNGGALQLTPGTVNGTATLTGANAVVGSTFTYAGGATLGLTRNGTGSVSYTVGNVSPSGSVLVRSNNGTLVIAPTASANLGVSEKFIVNGLTAAANKNGASSSAGIYDASVVDQVGTGNTGVGSFVKYDATNGFQDAATGTTVYTTAVTGTTLAANTISDVTSSISINAASNPYAVRVGAFTLTNSGTTTVNGGTASSTNSGLGGIILNPTATASTITGGTLDFGSSEGVVYVGSGAGGGVIASAITGSAGLTKFGPGTLTISNTGNTYTGTTTVNSGTLAEGASNVIASGNLTVNGPTAIFSLGGFTDTVGTVTVANGGSITGTAGNTLTSTGSFEMKSGSVSAILAGTGIALNKTTSGTMTLSGSNTYTGGTNLNGGILNLGVAQSATGGPLGGTGASVATSTMGAITFGGGTLQYSASNTVDYSSKFSTATSQAFNIDTNGQAVTFGTALAGSGNTLTKTGSGTLTLNAASTYTGLTTVNAGTLAEGTNNALSTGDLTVDGITAIFGLGASHTDSVGTVTVANGGAITGTGTSALTSTGTFEMKSGSASAILAGGGTLNKTTTGNVTLSGANTYTGNTAVAGGTLLVTGSLANNASNKVFISSPDSSLLGNPVLSRTRALSASYAGFGATAGTVASPTLTRSDLLGGTNSTGSDTTVAMSFRNATAGDTSAGVIGEVFSLTGMVNTGAVSGQTDIFVLQMSYDDALVASEASLALAGGLYLSYYDTLTSTWLNAIAGDFGSNTGLTNVQGSWAGAGGSSLALGTWGVDTTNNTVWAVVDHNTEFAVLAAVPEPSTYALLGFGLGALWILRRRKSASKV